MDRKRRRIFCRPGRIRVRGRELYRYGRCLLCVGARQFRRRIRDHSWTLDCNRGRRDQTIIATKVGKHPQFQGLSAKTILAAAENSLKRLGTEYIDLYYAHADDEKTPLEETLGAFDGLVREGKVRYIAASNYSAPRLAKALEVSEREGFARYVALQQHYNLMERHQYEGQLADLVAKEPFVNTLLLAGSGFLTGKYRPGRKSTASGRKPQVLT